MEVQPISLWMGKKPTLRTYERIGWYLSGMTSEEELLAHIFNGKCCEQKCIMARKAKVDPILSSTGKIVLTF